MRLPRLRITVLGLMVIVALIGTFMGGTMMGLRLGRLAEEYRRPSVQYIQSEEQAAIALRTYEAKRVAGMTAAGFSRGCAIRGCQATLRARQSANRTDRSFVEQGQRA
jgi:hypothetical protein